MNKLSPLFCAVTLALSASAAHASFDNFIGDSTLDTKFRTIYYDMQMDYKKSFDPGIGATIDYDVEASIEDLGASIWLNYQSGWLFNMVGVELGYQGAAIAFQDGTIDGTDTTFGGMANFSVPSVQFSRNATRDHTCFVILH